MIPSQGSPRVSRRSVLALVGLVVLGTGPSLAVHLACAHHDDPAGVEHGCDLCRALQGNVALPASGLAVAEPAPAWSSRGTDRPAPVVVDLPRPRVRAPPVPVSVA